MSLVSYFLQKYLREKIEKKNLYEFRLILKKVDVTNEEIERMGM